MRYAGHDQAHTLGGVQRRAWLSGEQRAWAPWRQFVLLGAGGGAIVEALAVFRCAGAWQDALRNHDGTISVPPRLRRHVDVPVHAITLPTRVLLGASAAALCGITRQVTGPYGAAAIGCAAPVLLAQLGSIHQIGKAVNGASKAREEEAAEPPALDGYSVARRALAGLLGVRLITPEEEAGPARSTTSRSPGMGRSTSAAAAIAVADPVVRLTVRQSRLTVAVPMAELLVRIVEIADSLTSSEGHVSYSNLARARHLSRNVDRALARALGHAFYFGHDLDCDRALDLAHDLARDRAHVLDLAAALGHAFYFDRALGLSHGLTHTRALTRALTCDHGRVLALRLARVLDRPINHVLDRAHVLAPDRVLDQAFARVPAVALSPGRTIELDVALLAALDRALGDACDLARHRERALDIACTQDRDLAQDSDRAFVRILALALTHARELDSALAGALSDSLGIEHLDGLADALLDGALDDFSQADLSSANLSHIRLAGVRWSVPGTRWPPSLDVEMLIQQSEETEPGSGIYVVTRREGTERSL